MEIKLLIVGSTLLSITVPAVAGWTLSCPSRQAEQGLWRCLVCVTQPGGSGLCSLLNALLSKTAALCPKRVCVVY